MAAPVFQDGVTPLNAATFNALGAEVDAKVAASAPVNGKWLKGVGGAAVWSDITPADVGVPDAGGWLPLAATWTFVSADGPTFAIKSLSFFGNSIHPGCKIRLDHGGVTKYFIVTDAIFPAETDLTLYGGTDYTLSATGAITNVYVSRSRAPHLFPMNPLKWTQAFVDSVDRAQNSPAAGTYYNLGASKLDVPIGAWSLEYFVTAQISAAASEAQPATRITLGTSPTVATDNEFSSGWSINYTVAAAYVNSTRLTARKNVLLAAKTSYYLLMLTGANSNQIAFLGSSGTNPTIIRATCAYL